MVGTDVDEAKYRRLRAHGVTHQTAVAMSSIPANPDFASGGGSSEPGPPGPAGPPGGSYTRFYGEGPPGTVLGSAPGDEYLDTLTGTLYALL